MQTKRPLTSFSRQVEGSVYAERRMMRKLSKPDTGNRKPGTFETGYRKLETGEEKPVRFPLSGFKSIRGRVGDQVYKTYGDRIVVMRVPRFDGYQPTSAQQERREKMRAATAYARAVYADPALKAIYVAAAKQLGRQPFRLAVSDFLRGRPRVMLKVATARAEGGKRSAPGSPSIHCDRGRSRSQESRSRGVARGRARRPRRRSRIARGMAQALLRGRPTEYMERLCRNRSGKRKSQTPKSKHQIQPP